MQSLPGMKKIVSDKEEVQEESKPAEHVLEQGVEQETRKGEVAMGNRVSSSATFTRLYFCASRALFPVLPL